jgi:hypothetical protein
VSAAQGATAALGLSLTRRDAARTARRRATISTLAGAIADAPEGPMLLMIGDQMRHAARDAGAGPADACGARSG